MHESAAVTPADLPVARERWPVVWLDVDGFEDAAVIREVARIFQIGQLRPRRRDHA